MGLAVGVIFFFSGDHIAFHRFSKGHVYPERLKTYRSQAQF